MYFEIEVQDLHYQFEFSFDDQSLPNTVKTEKPSEKSLKYKFINFITLLTTTIRGEVGYIDDKRLYLAIGITNLSTDREQPRVVNFMFTLGGAVV